MRIRYPAPTDRVVPHGSPHFLLADHGSWMSFGWPHNASAFQGISFLDLSTFLMEKVVHDVRVEQNRVQELVVAPGRVLRHGDAASETFFFHDRIACYAVRGAGKVRMTFDVRDAYDFSEEGREHTIAVRGSHPWMATVSARGKSFVVLASSPLVIDEGWVPRPTRFDARRGGSSSWWVRAGVQCACTRGVRMVIAPAHRAEEARAVLLAPGMWHQEIPHWEHLVPEIAFASLSGLVTRTPSGEAGILAGLPWFFQIYARDEAICVGALLARREFLLAGRILLREVSLILPDGRIPNRFPSSDTGSADGVGWAFLRLHELFAAQQDALTREQWEFVLQQLSRSLETLLRASLVPNGPKETWMDTTGGTNDTRSGYRIEIQCLTLRMLRFAVDLASWLGHDAGRWRVREGEMRSAVRDAFFDASSGFLADGVSGVVDATPRPNVFLALYAYPWLLSSREWLRVAQHALSALVCPWHGICTIDRAHARYLGRHSGADDRSYHRGDVWYFMNNLAGVALLRLDPSFRDVAMQLYEASVHDLLSLGAAGHASEVSSAEQQEALGCWSQAWSASSLVELHYALFPF